MANCVSGVQLQAMLRAACMGTCVGGGVTVIVSVIDGHCLIVKATPGLILVIF